jgi:hypothetical protein
VKRRGKKQNGQIYHHFRLCAIALFCR